ncbi:MAG: zinc ABC transporter solute-binding protein [Phycisphaerales bacterium]|nr:zinc ABC transporter solute-binding protein [Phycisphaerales bacterium]
MYSSMSRTLVRLRLALFTGGLVGLTVFAGTACRQQEPAPISDSVAVSVSIPPLKYFVERVGGEHVTVTTLLPPGQSPHTYEPTARQIVTLSGARVFFATGLRFERQMADQIGQTLTKLEQVDLHEELELRRITEKEAHDHEHDEAGRCLHEYDELDPHVWMDPRLVKIQAETIARVLSRIDPAHREDYERSCRQFQQELDELDRQIRETLAPYRGRAFFVYHPAYGYFAEAYGLEQVAVEISGKQPTARQLGELVERAKKSGVKLVFVQPQFSPSAAEAVAEQIGGVVTPLDPLAEDYMENLLTVCAKIKEAFGTATPAAGGE